MLPKILELEDGVVKLSPEVMLIPQFKAVVEKYEDPIPPMSYVYFMTSPESAYANMPDDDKQYTISVDVGGDFGFEDPEIIAALDKAKLLFTTPTRRLFEGAKRNLDRLSVYLSDEEIQSGRDGNLGEIFRIQTGLAKIVAGFKALEKMTDEEFKNLRGGAEQGRY